MESSLPELLSNVDKMVAGSIVGSVVLAFLLLVVIFSLRIRSLHQVIRDLRLTMDAKEKALTQYQADITGYQKQMEDTRSVMDHYQAQEAALQKELESLRYDKNQMAETLQVLRGEINQLRDENKKLADDVARSEAERQKVQEEIAAALKRNEFWVEQLSQLRTKYDALLLKLRKMEQA